MCSQINKRQHLADKNLIFRDGWTIAEQSFQPDQMITTGSNFMIGNGYLGYRGTFEEWGKQEYVACIVTDTYDTADGKWNELCNVPNGLYMSVQTGGQPIILATGKVSHYERCLNLHNGLFKRSLVWRSDNEEVSLSFEKFASMAQLNTLALSCEIVPQGDMELEVVSGIDGDVWSLNGDHFQSISLAVEKGCLISRCITRELHTEIIVAEGIQVIGATVSASRIAREANKILRHLTLQGKAGQPIRIIKFAEIRHTNETTTPQEDALGALASNLKKGYSQIKAAHEEKWRKIWHLTDVRITGDDEAQVLTRFNLYHNVIATPQHASLPIGARGLSCQAYQGAAFWDQEIFNMPMFLYTQPAIARNILKYRYDTLDGAREKAKALGYEGAYYAWISGKTGEELCPSFFFKDVLTGRLIRNHFNCWQMHISPDITYAIWHYYQVTEDWDFIVSYGAEIVFEIARLIFSYGFFKPHRQRYEMIRLLGPDEYHENVDNNAFTNYQCQYALEKACSIFTDLQASDPESLARITQRISLINNEINNWRDMAAKLYLPQPDPDTQLIEQFDGYFQLEDTTPAEIKKRLQDPGEYHGWPNGIAVHTQVLKQADVIQLFCLQDTFTTQIERANYNYYEPRTEHGSSLSPSAYATIACKTGNASDGYQHFIKSSSVDLYNTGKAVSGGTFIGGIHTAACGAAWSVLTTGFAGLKLAGESVSFSPCLPSHWQSISFHLQIRGQRFRVEINQHSLRLTADPGNESSVSYLAENGKAYQVAAGQELVV